VRLRCGARETDCRLVIADKDGTLVDFRSVWVPVVQARARFIVEEAAVDRGLEPALLRAFGYDPDDGRVDPRGPLAIAPRTETTVIGATLLYRAGLAWEDAMAAVRRAYRRADEAVDPIRVGRAVPGVEAALRRLRAAGARLAVVTTDTTVQAERGLAALGWADLFEAVVGADGVTLPKPHPEAVERLCRTVGVPAGETVVIGDALADVLMGKGAGVALTVGVLTGVTTAAEFRDHADVIVDSLADIGPAAGAGTRP
jgi:phosphoglycolate phosphatase